MRSDDRLTTFPQVMFAGNSDLIYTCQSGIFVSQDLGKTWLDMSFNLPDKAVTALTLAPDGTAFISTYGAGVWTFPDFLAAVGNKAR